MTGIGVAISTTGDEHRLGFLETSVREWDRVLPAGSSLFVTVDGNREDVRRVAEVVHDVTESVFQVGPPRTELVNAVTGAPTGVFSTSTGIRRLGVAANKNTGLELLMNTRADHLFLSDDDTYPLYTASLDKHTQLGSVHSMVCWGAKRHTGFEGNLATWGWPRGVMLYVQRRVVETIGGMDERFGPGGHEHVEWSNRIHNAGFTITPYPTPASYATRNARGAAALWHCEDMPRLGETLGGFRVRKRHNTSVRRADGDWAKIDALMIEREGSSDYVGYRAHENGRASATLGADLLSLGAGGEK